MPESIKKIVTRPFCVFVAYTHRLWVWDTDLADVPISDLAIVGRYVSGRKTIFFRFLPGTCFQQPQLKAIGPFRYRKKKNHRFTNNLHGLQKVMVKDVS